MPGVRDFTARMLGLMRELDACAVANLREIERLKEKGQIILRLITIAQHLAVDGKSPAQKPKKRKKRSAPGPTRSSLPPCGGGIEAPLVAASPAPGPPKKIGGGGALSSPPFRAELEAIVKLARCYAGPLEPEFIARVLTERGELRMDAAGVEALLVNEGRGRFERTSSGKFSLKKGAV